MKIEELEGKRISVGRTSITIKDADGKTRGMIRNIIRFTDASPRVQFEFAKAVRAAGIWNNDKLKTANVIISGGTAYYLHNMKSYEFNERMQGLHPEDATYKASNDKTDALLKTAAECIPVIRVYEC